MRIGEISCFGPDDGDGAIAMLTPCSPVFDFDLNFIFVDWNWCIFHEGGAAPFDAEVASSNIRFPSSDGLPRVIITFKRPVNGLNFRGMLSQVFLPMTTALSVLVLIDSSTGT